MDSARVADAIRDVAARIIVPRFGRLRPDQVASKRPGDLVTVADTEAEAELTRILAASDPAALIVGEEATFTDPGLLAGLASADHAWVIDPVDGTGNFAHGSPDFGVMIAELRHGETVRSWIWQPMHQRMFAAERGAGVESDLVLPESVPSEADPLARVVGCVPRRFRRDPVADFELRRTSGSCAIDYPRVLTGEVGLLGYWHCRPWDHLPGALMLTERGGHVAVHPHEAYRAGVSGPVLFAAASVEIWRRADRALITPSTFAPAPGPGSPTV